MSSSTDFFGSTSSSPDPFGSAFDSFNSAVIVSVVVSSIATVAIVIAIIYCIKTAADSAPKYMQLAIDAQQHKHHEQRKAVDSDHPKSVELSQVTVSEVLEAATMERFLSDMAKEKPLRFSSKQLRHFTNDFSTRLGSGGFGVVYKGEFPNGVHIAVKVLNNNLGKQAEEQFMAEVATMGRTYHINLVRLYGFCFDSTLQALVYEYMENGSLDHLLFHQDPNNNNNLDWDKMQEIALGTAKGIAYLHEDCQQRIIHYDIKPGNVLLDSSMNPKVADFGLATLCSRDNTHVELSGVKGTPGYAAPEVWMPYHATYKCDVYSFGMTLMEMVMGRRNHMGGEVSGTSREWMPQWVYKKVQREELEVMMTELGVSDRSREKAERAALVALWCVQYLPSARPNMSEVVRMLEGGVPIPTPPNPFGYLDGDTFSSGMGSSTQGGSTFSVMPSNHTYPLIKSGHIRTTL